MQTTYAKLDIPLKLIVDIKIEDDHERASFQLQNGDKVKGVLNLKPIELETIFGNITVGIEHINSIRIHQGDALAESVRKGLVLHYSFDHDEKEKISDRSGKENDGTIHGAKWTPKGKNRAAYVFDGVDDYIDMDLDSSIPKGIGKGSFAVAVWLKSQTPRSGPGYVIEQHIRGAPWTGIYLSVEPTNFRFRTDDTGGVPTSSALFDVSKIVDDEEWHHYVAVREDSVLYLYLDGVKKVEKRVPLVNLSANYAGPLRMGAHCQDGKCANYNGAIDEVMIWNRALSEKEVEQLYNSQK
ncbi:LamG domain-containing protein [Verrucomicrobiota bacterium]